jgi:hypothetical protein
MCAKGISPLTAVNQQASAAGLGHGLTRLLGLAALGPGLDAPASDPATTLRVAPPLASRGNLGVAPQGVGAPVAANRGCRGRQSHDALRPAPEDDEEDRQQDQGARRFAQDYPDPMTAANGSGRTFYPALEA